MGRIQYPLGITCMALLLVSSVIQFAQAQDQYVTQQNQDVGLQMADMLGDDDVNDAYSHYQTTGDYTGFKQSDYDDTLHLEATAYGDCKQANDKMLSRQNPCDIVVQADDLMVDPSKLDGVYHPVSCLNDRHVYQRINSKSKEGELFDGYFIWFEQSRFAWIFSEAKSIDEAVKQLQNGQPMLARGETSPESNNRPKFVKQWEVQHGLLLKAMGMMVPSTTMEPVNIKITCVKGQFDNQKKDKGKLSGGLRLSAQEANAQFAQAYQQGAEDFKTHMSAQSVIGIALIVIVSLAVILYRRTISQLQYHYKGDD